MESTLSLPPPKKKKLEMQVLHGINVYYVEVKRCILHTDTKLHFLLHTKCPIMDFQLTIISEKLMFSDFALKRG